MSDLITMMSAAAGQVGGFNPRKYFNTVLYTGNTPSTNAITGVGFAPDLVWVKSRTVAEPSNLVDRVRGDNLRLKSSTTDAESAATFALNSDGFTVGANSESNTGSMVAWNWKADGAGVSNTAGTITGTVTVSANTIAGISIVTYTGTGTNVTVGHGLGAAPKMVIVKNRSGSAGWRVYNSNLTSAAYVIYLNVTNAETLEAIAFNSTAPTASVFSLGTSANTNGSGDLMVAYCFAEVEGFSKFGSYTGNGSATGPSVTTDFEPTWLMIKRTDTTGDWIILDSARDTANPRDKFLEPNTGDAEATGNDVDFNATGFQLKSTSASINASGGTYIYACFA